MRLPKWLTVVVLMLIVMGSAILPQLPAHSQNEPTMRYAFVFKDVMPLDYRVAVLDSDGQWTVTPLPGLENFAWSLDGTLYGVQTTPVPLTATSTPSGFPQPDPRNGVTVVALVYPDWQAVRTFDVWPAEEITDPLQADVLRFQSISPDGNFAWVTEEIKRRAALVNLKTGEVLYRADCPGRVIGWGKSKVIVAGRAVTPRSADDVVGECPVHLYSVDAVTRTMTELPSGSSFLSSPVLEYILSPDARYLIYIAGIPNDLWNTALVRLDVATSKVTTLDDTGIKSDLHWEDSTLAYKVIRSSLDAQGQRIDDTYQVWLDEAGQQREDLILHESLTEFWSDDVVVRNVATADGGLYAVAYWQGEEVWRSTTELPFFEVSQRSVVWDYPTDRYRWLRVWATANDFIGDFVFDVEQMALIPTPQNWQVVDISPDGEWFILTSYHNIYDPGLMAYHPATGEQVILSETARYDTLELPNARLLWSPMPE